MLRNRRIETEVVRCIGETDLFVQVPFTFATSDPTGEGLPFYIENVTVNLQDYDLSITEWQCCRAVMFSGTLFVNVLYKTGAVAEGTINPTINGALYQQTQLVTIGGCIPMDCEKFRDCGKILTAKLVDVCISEGHTLINPFAASVGTAFPFYNGLTENICVKVKAKIVTDEIIELPFDDDDDCHFGQCEGCCQK